MRFARDPALMRLEPYEQMRNLGEGCGSGRSNAALQRGCGHLQIAQIDIDQNRFFEADVAAARAPECGAVKKRACEVGAFQIRAIERCAAQRTIAEVDAIGRGVAVDNLEFP